jgi:hypothetical protein
LKVTPACDLREKAPPSANATKAGVTETAFEAGPVALAFVAVALQVYAVPFVSPVTVIGEAEPLAAKPPLHETV